MKILLINNFYYNRGGDCTYMFNLKKLLETKGHNVIVFSMHHPENFSTECSKYFVSYINYDEEVKDVSIASGIDVLKRTIFSWEAKKKIERLIEDERPDIAHMHNIHHHITPSIFYPLKKHKIPIVWTLHDYSVICPNTSFLSQGRICERCKKRKYFWPPLTKCKKNSFGASAMAAMETSVHNIMCINSLVDIFIAPSEFLRNKFIEYGFKKEKLICQHYFVDPDSCTGSVSGINNNEDYYLYIGRLSEEKGIKTLIDAAIVVNKYQGCQSALTTFVKLKIVGGGPLRDNLESYANANAENNFIEFLGHKSQDEVMQLIRGCKFVVVPSEWYENFPFAILETFVCGKSVIGSRVGGIPELIRDTERGMVFETGDSADLSAVIKYLLNNPDIAVEMGRNARKYVAQELNGEKHYEDLIQIYGKVLKNNNG
jgi:glycosyltransferase involved in cell wall biosynthesis